MEKTPLQSLQEIFSREMVEVDRAIHSNINHSLPLISQVCHHILSSGGKRLRPLLALAGAKIYGNITERVITAAAMIELLHSATLLHDDIVDGSILRRGKETAHIKWGNALSLLVGDFLFGQTFELMTGLGDFNILKLFSPLARQIIEGEVRHMQITLSSPTDILIQAMSEKTATLFGTSCQIGAITTGQRIETTQHLYDFGYHLGITFQLLDDIYDYTRTNRGKEPGEDFYSGKITLPVLLAYQEGREPDFLERIFHEHRILDGDFHKALKVLRPYFEKTLGLAKNYAATAAQFLEPLPDSPLKNTLMSLAEFLCMPRLGSINGQIQSDTQVQ